MNVGLPSIATPRTHRGCAQDPLGARGILSHPDALTPATESTPGQLPLLKVNVYGADSLSVVTDFTFEATVAV